MNTGDSPPGNGKGALAGANPENESHNLEQLVTCKRRFCKRRIVQVRRCLPPDIWEWLIWEAAANTGGWLP